MEDVGTPKIYELLSPQRLTKYSKAGSNNIEVYKWNISLCEALYPLLHTIEIPLRNRLHKAVSSILNEKEWLLNRNSQLLARLDSYWAKKIDDLIINLRKKSKLDEGHMIAELSFGFWTALLSGAFEKDNFLWPRIKHEVFPNSGGVSVSVLRKRFNEARNLRNMVFHYRSIWHWHNLLEQHDNIIEAIHWIDTELIQLIKKDRFNEVYARGLDVKK